MDIFDEIMRMREEFDRMLNRFFSSKFLALPSEKSIEESSFRMPVADVRDLGNSIAVNIELPGVEKENIDLNVRDDLIEVKAKRKVEKEVKRKGSYSYEARDVSFYRKIPLSEEVDADKAVATYRNGVLKIIIPKKKAKKGKKITIK